MSLEEFKKNTRAKSISTVITSGRPLSEKWGFQEFVLRNEKVLENFFDKKIYQIYKNLSEEEKEEAIKWFEIHGIECTEMYGGELHENWNDDTIPKRDLEKLSAMYPDMYKLVVKNVVEEMYKQFDEGIRQIIIEKYVEEWQTFEEEIKKNAK